MFKKWGGYLDMYFCNICKQTKWNAYTEKLINSIQAEHIISNSGITIWISSSKVVARITVICIIKVEMQDLPTGSFIWANYNTRCMKINSSPSIYVCNRLMEWAWKSLISPLTFYLHFQISTSELTPLLFNSIPHFLIVFPNF